MRTIENLIIATSILLSSMSVHAYEVKTPATALTLCKAEAKLAHPKQTKIVSKKIKQMRGKFKINLRISTPEGKVNTLCEITKDGEITYSKI